MQVVNLRAYLANIEMSLRDFAVLAECDPTHLSRVLSGYSPCSQALSNRISELTGGVINLPYSTFFKKKQRPTSTRKKKNSEGE